MGCATATIKYLVFIFNALCAVIGIGVIVVASLSLNNVAEDDRGAVIFFIVIGSIVFLISFFGCCGAIKESVCLTWLYAIIMLILLILTCVLVFVYLDKIDDEDVVRKQMNEDWQHQKNGTDSMSYYQNNFKCCGINGPDDYTKANLTIPASCYGNHNNNGTVTNKPQTSNKGSLYTDGCFQKYWTDLEKVLKSVHIVQWILIGVEGAAFICASILAVTFGNEHRRSRY